MSGRDHDLMGEGVSGHVHDLMGEGVSGQNHNLIGEGKSGQDHDLMAEEGSGQDRDLMAEGHPSTSESRRGGYTIHVTIGIMTHIKYAFTNYTGKRDEGSSSG